MLNLQILAQGQPVALFDLPALMGRGVAAREIGDTIEGLIAFMDDLGGDPDLEDGGDSEPDDDAKGDISWAEWHTRGTHKTQSAFAEQHEPIRNAAGWTAGEDDEDDDPAEIDDEPEDEHDRELDVGDMAEGEQMLHDVPMLSAFALEPGADGKRAFVGITNMQSSFRTNGSDRLSADSGRMHRSKGWVTEIGSPV